MIFRHLPLLLTCITPLYGQVIIDTDDDGLDDAWELTYFTNLDSTSGTDDPDTDLLDNLGEQTKQTIPTLPDSDGDGLLDGEEVSSANGAITDPANEDSDNDGFNDRVELERNTNPNNGGEKPAGLLPIEINEIVVSNETGLEDRNDRRSDWIELYNPNPSALNLLGFHLTDDASAPSKWSFPSVQIPGQGYLIVFASGDGLIDPTGNLHTNFRLSASGDYLALASPDLSLTEDLIRPSYPAQFTDISYGRPTTGGGRRFFSPPTPGSANLGNGSPGVVNDTNFSVDRGFHDTSFQLEITSATPRATIQYTLDGSRPSLTNGTTYETPLSISSTSNVRAVAYLESQNFLPTNIDTQTYIFVDDVAGQNAPDLIAKGWAPNWGYDSEVNQVIPADYDMDPRVVNDDLNLRGPGYTIRDALLDIPTVSISMQQEDFVQTRTGTSTFPRSLYGTPRERDLEPTCSVEYLLPDGTRGFQEDCKIETHGNSSRRPARMQKHSLRLTFSTEVGPAKLRYNLFPESPVDEFNKLVLRACFTDSWALASWSGGRYRPNDSLYTRDVWMKELYRKMGQPSSYGNFVHLYVNGAYFGLHNLTERIEDDFYADHLGGEREDWEVNADLATPGPLWNSMMATLNAGVTSAAAYEVAKTKIDVENYADWVILHLFGDAEDWPTKNSYAAANALSGDGRYRFNIWDQEIAFDKYSWNRYADNREGMKPFQKLRLNEDFQMLFADRVYKHLHDDGALMATNASNTLLGIHQGIDKAIIAESARWGDVQASTPYGSALQSSSSIENDAYPPVLNNPPYFTREQHWLVEQENLVTNYLPTLNDTDDSRSFIRELRTNNLYPDIDPPLFSQLGGVVPENFPLRLTTAAGAVYFTTDGSDPRLNGGAPNPNAGSFGGATETDLIGINDFGWTYLSSPNALSASDVIVGASGYGPGDWKHPSYNDETWAPDPTLSPNGAQGPFEGRSPGAVSGIAQANTLLDIGPTNNGYPTLYFRKKFNLTEASRVLDLSFNLIRDDAVIIYLNGREIYRDDFENARVIYTDPGPRTSETIPLEFTHPISPGELLEGDNFLAIELHNSSVANNDLGLQLAMSGRIAAPAGNTLILSQTSTVKSRTFFEGEWSALREAEFIVGTPAASGNLVISEIMYNPLGADENLEFIEVLNIHPDLTLDLTQVSFIDGILYTFPTGFTLAPHQHVVITKDRPTFITRYGESGITLAPGNFEGSLSNSGESIILTGNDGSLLQSFSYGDSGSPGWPIQADGFGSSLCLIDPISNPDHTIASNWKASRIPGGTPGLPDVLFPIDPDGDADNDGLENLAEYFFDTDPQVANENPVSLLNTSSGLTLTFGRNPFLEDLTWEIQSSPDLDQWTTDSLIPQLPVVNGSGRLQESFEIPAAGSSRFYRVRILSTQ